jgi:hypothetical protein
MSAKLVSTRGRVADVEPACFARASVVDGPGGHLSGLDLLDVETDNPCAHMRRPDGHGLADA